MPPQQNVASMKDLLTSGVHFGHQTRRWNPKMKPYIFGERGGIYIIDLQKTSALLDEAYAFLKRTSERGGTVLFVGTKKQCQETIQEQAERIGMPFVSTRWLGGLLTNYTTLSKRIKRMHELRQLQEDGSLDLLPTREGMKLRGDLRKLEQNLGGVQGMDKLPAAVFVVDPRKEQIVVREARKLNIPIVALVDTNCDPDEVDYVIPGNDDAIRSCALIVRVVADAVAEGRQLLTEAEMKAEAERKAAEEAAIAEAVAAAEAAAKETAAAELAAAQAAAEAPAPAGAPAAGRTAPDKAAADAAGRPAPKKTEAPRTEHRAKPEPTAKPEPAGKADAAAKGEAAKAEPADKGEKAKAAPKKPAKTAASAATAKAESAPEPAKPAEAEAHKHAAPTADEEPAKAEATAKPKKAAKAAAAEGDQQPAPEEPADEPAAEAKAAEQPAQE